MDRTGSEKRAREATGGGGITEQKRHAGGVAPSSKREKGKPGIAETQEFFPVQDEEELHWTAACGVPEDCLRPPGVFEFPWKKGEGLLTPEPEGWGPDYIRDVFFSSLVDGCSAAVGIPGDRFSPTSSGDLGFRDMGEWWTSDEELDGVDSIAAAS